MSNNFKVNACKDAERQYNLCVSWLSDDYTGYTTKELETADSQYFRMRKVYSETLYDLEAMGIGGVLINGSFRSTFQER